MTRAPAASARFVLQWSGGRCRRVVMETTKVLIAYRTKRESAAEAATEI
jgi:hypothetical protein